MVGLVRISLRLLADILQLAVSLLRPARALATENLVLRRQLALYRERGIKPRRVDPATRASLAFLTRLPEMGMVRVRSVLGGLHHEYSWAKECI